MLDLSFITGAAPAAARTSRTQHAAGTEAADPASFIDALVQVAAFAVGEEPAASPDNLNLPVLDTADAEDAAETEATPEVPPVFGVVPVPETVVDAPPVVSALHSTHAEPGEQPLTSEATAVPGIDQTGDTEAAPYAASLPAASVAVASATTDAPDTPASPATDDAAPRREATTHARAVQMSGSPVAQVSDTRDDDPVEPVSRRPGRPLRPVVDTGGLDQTHVATRPASEAAAFSESVDSESRRSKAAAQRSVADADAAVRDVVETTSRAVRVGEATARVARPDTSTPLPTAIPVEIVPGTVPNGAPVAVADPLASLSTSAGHQRPSSDSGESTHGYVLPAGPRLAAPPAVTPAPAFTSLVNASATSDALPAETTTQIVQSIRLQMLRDGGEAHIRLDPRQFGDMTVRVKVEQGQVVARVEADAPVVREWLQSNQHVLRQSLAGQQLTLDRLEVHEPPVLADRGRRDGDTGQGGQQDQGRQHRRQRQQTSELFEVMA